MVMTPEIGSPATAFRHAVRFFPDRRARTQAICDFVAAGFELGEPAVLALDAQTSAGVGSELALRGFRSVEGRVEIVSAEEAAAVVGGTGKADKNAFFELITPVLDRVLAGSKTGRVRAYGEIVDVLRRTGRLEAALGLERLWTELGGLFPFTLLCGYDAEALEGADGGWDLIDRHEVVLPEESERELNRALEKAIEKVLGAQIWMVRTMVASQPKLSQLPFGQAALLWMRRNMPFLAGRVVEHARAS